MKEKKGIIIAGAVVGLLAVILVKFGNPANMGMCIACFIRDIAGALGLQRAEVVQYIRPEIIGIVMGAFLTAFGMKEFSSKGGSSPLVRFMLGFIVMVGALMFLGCTISIPFPYPSLTVLFPFHQPGMPLYSWGRASLQVFAILSPLPRWIPCRVQFPYL
jgi:hypothetical protein